MGVCRYYYRLLSVAFSHSISRAHAIVFLLIIFLGFSGWLLPPIIHIGMEPEGWVVATVVLGAVVGLRLVMAPYWIHLEQEQRIPKTRPEWQRINTDLYLAIKYISHDSGWAATKDRWDLEESAAIALAHSIKLGELDVWGIQDREYTPYSEAEPIYKKINLSHWDTHEIDIMSALLPRPTQANTVKILGQPRDLPQNAYSCLKTDRADVLKLWPEATTKEKRLKSRRMKLRRQKM
jgi:hypothetical protein